MMYLKVPKSRIGVLIGKKGKIKKEVENKSGVVLSIDSEEGDVVIDDSHADPLMALKARDFVRAVANGFSPERAWRIFKEDVYFEVIDIKEFVGKRENRIRVLRGRIIGKNGKTRRIIEELSGASISVYEYSVAIIGNYNQVEVAKRAVEMLLRGSKHATIYHFLEKKRRDMKYSAFEYYHV
ncbi:MAG: RNA-processing protein [Thermoplasmata archaeon]|uniref:RNA-processing protein n=1 Tax=Candidatus Aciduliprofundum boonei TaxID=379547 RepID=A0A7J3T9E5_9ARCH|nr:RNA-processing protein [Thermoplasmata archaeon]HHE75700.1 RNA-processing protein [Candidatus Aciduliprofundum boonei]